jgi:formate-dependent nitrite reductase cytochrome c552 subunit
MGLNVFHHPTTGLGYHGHHGRCNHLGCQGYQDRQYCLQCKSEMLEEARQLHREAQLRWDFIAAENSMGFHNPTEALRILASATDIARQAQKIAITVSDQGMDVQTNKPELPCFKF